MRLVDTLRTRLRAPLEKLVAAEVARQVEAQKLDALYKYRWHGDRSRLHIPATAVVNNALFNVSGGEITLGEYVFFGHDVAILTGTHDIEKFGLERQMTFPRSGRDVVIGDGVWLASHVLVLGPVTIGEHSVVAGGAAGGGAGGLASHFVVLGPVTIGERSVVAGGSLVREDIEPYTVVAGRPAKVVKKI